MNTSNYDYNTKLSFVANWYRYETDQLRTFKLQYYPYDNTIEMYDMDLNRTFLKRSAEKNIQMKDFFLGNTIRIYRRQLELIAYGDDTTRDIVSKTMAHTFILVKPSMYMKLGTVIEELQHHGFKVFNMRMAQLSRREALDYYRSKKGDVSLASQIEHVISGYCIGMEMVGENAIKKCMEVLGPSDPAEARKTHPNSLRAKYGLNIAINGFHGAPDHNTAIEESCFFFSKNPETPPPKSTIILKNSACCIIKPHVISDGNLGSLIRSIQENPLFRITAIRMFHFTTPDCLEFVEVYKGIVDNFDAFILSYLDGPCVALEICGYSDDIDVHKEFRKFCGPSNSHVAKQIRPESLRAKYGIDKYFNAVHCTDLPEDAVLELEYVFQMLD